MQTQWQRASPVKALRCYASGATAGNYVAARSKSSVAASAARSVSSTLGPLVTLRFKIHYKAAYNHRLCLVGDHAELGAWTVQASQPMQWHAGNYWTVDVSVPAGSSLEYKYVVVDSTLQEVRWQAGRNLRLQVPTVPLVSPRRRDLMDGREATSQLATSAVPANTALKPFACEVFDSWCKDACSLHPLDLNIPGSYDVEASLDCDDSSCQDEDQPKQAAGSASTALPKSAPATPAAAERKTKALEQLRAEAKAHAQQLEAAPVTPTPSPMSSSTPDASSLAAVPATPATAAQQEQQQQQPGQKVSLSTTLLLAAAAARDAAKSPQPAHPMEAPQQAHAPAHAPAAAAAHASESTPAPQPLQQEAQQHQQQEVQVTMQLQQVQQQQEEQHDASPSDYSISYMHSPHEMDIYMSHASATSSPASGRSPPSTPTRSTSSRRSQQRQQAAAPAAGGPSPGRKAKSSTGFADAKPAGSKASKRRGVRAPSSPAAPLFAPEPLSHAPFPVPEPLGTNSIHPAAASALAAAAAAAAAAEDTARTSSTAGKRGKGKAGKSSSKSTKAAMDDALGAAARLCFSGPTPTGLSGSNAVPFGPAGSFRTRVASNELFDFSTTSWVAPPSDALLPPPFGTAPTHPPNVASGGERDWPGQTLFDLRRSMGVDASLLYDDDELQLDRASAASASGDLSNGTDSTAANIARLLGSSGMPVVGDVELDPSLPGTGADSAASESALALTSPPMGAVAAAELVSQLGSVMGTSVALRSQGSDAASSDLLALDRQIALFSARLYERRDPLLEAFVRVEGARQLKAAAATAAAGVPVAASS